MRKEMTYSAALIKNRSESCFDFAVKFPLMKISKMQHFWEICWLNKGPVGASFVPLVAQPHHDVVGRTVHQSISATLGSRTKISQQPHGE